MHMFFLLVNINHKPFQFLPTGNPQQNYGYGQQGGYQQQPGGQGAPNQGYNQGGAQQPPNQGYGQQQNFGNQGTPTPQAGRHFDFSMSKLWT